MLAGVVTERVREAYQNKSAPMMMLFPGNQFFILYIVIHVILPVFFGGVKFLPDFCCDFINFIACSFKIS